MNSENLPEEGIDFEFLETQDIEVSGRSKNPIIKLHEKYEGVIVQYGKIQIVPDETKPTLSFDFAILNAGNQSKEVLNSDTGFKNLLGDIIASVLIEVHQNENRNNNSESPAA